MASDLRSSLCSGVSFIKFLSVQLEFDGLDRPCYMCYNLLSMWIYLFVDLIRTVYLHLRLCV